MKTRSLTRRVVLLVLLSELLCAVVLSCTALLHERRLRLHAFDLTLRAHADLLLDTIEDTRDQDNAVLAAFEKVNFPRDDTYAIYDSGGKLLGASSQAAPVLMERAGGRFRNRLVNGKEYRVFEEREAEIDVEATVGAVPPGPLTVVYAAETKHMQNEVFEAAGFYSGISLLILCATAALLILLLRKVLRPVSALATAASGISASALQFAPPIEALELRELQPLARALSNTMERLRLAFEAQHRFVGDATHELKTAVAVVRSTVQVLSLRPRSPEEYARGLGRLLEDNSRVELLVSRMLTLARFEESTDVLPNAVDLAESLESAAERLRSFTEALDVEVRFSREPHLWVRLAREGAEALITNLLVNAVQHSPSASTVQVVVRRGEGDPASAMLTVEDRGSGISAEALPHLFERFYREDTSRSRETGGAGLGLAICDAIVRNAGGTIEVQSQMGRGTKVSVRIPLA